MTNPTSIAMVPIVKYIHKELLSPEVPSIPLSLGCLEWEGEPVALSLILDVVDIGGDTDGDTVGVGVEVPL